MGKTKREPSREESFHKHYAVAWGEQRWHESLYPALARSTRHSALVNQALPPDTIRGILQAAGIPFEDLEPVSLPPSVSDDALCLARRLDRTLNGILAESPSFPQPQVVERSDLNVRLMSHWNMDAASILAACLLDVKSGETVLDLCAAPGGKSIALAQYLFSRADQASMTGTDDNGTQPLLCSNEADKTRYRRLSENLKAYLPGSLSVRCTNVDATLPNAHRELAIPGGYDKILVDAPCSSERHVIHAHIKAQASGRVAPEMANWRPGSTKRLQETQVKLLMTALRLVKNHGRVLYATCSIEPGENDGVIEKVMTLVEKERKKGLIGWEARPTGPSLAPTQGQRDPVQDFLELNWAERTKHGWIVLPDHTSGGSWGPLFFAKLTKVPAG